MRKFSAVLYSVLGTGLLSAQTQSYPRAGAGVASAQGGRINVMAYGAKGDGTTDDTTAIQNALNAACTNSGNGGSVEFPVGQYKTTATLTCTVTATLKGVHIFGHGPRSVILLSGAANGGIHFVGSAALGYDQFYISDIKIYSNTSGIAPYGVMFDSTAVYGTNNVIIDAAVGGHLNRGIYIFDSQQGYVRGGMVGQGAKVGVRLEGIVIGAHAQDISGMSLAPAAGRGSACFELAGTLAVDVSITGNHCTSADYGVHISGGAAQNVQITKNHFELHAIGSIVSDVTSTGQQVLVEGNEFYNTPNPEIAALGTQTFIVSNNMINGPVNFGVNCFSCKFINNRTFGAVTSSAINLVNYGNTTAGGNSPLAVPTLFKDPLRVDLTNGTIYTSGDLATLQPPAVDANWGMSIYSAGAGDAYLKLHGPVLAGDTSGAILRIKSGVGGAVWNTFTASLSTFQAAQIAETTVGALGTCNASAAGTIRAVSDAAAAPLYNSTAVGGGTVHLLVACNGSNWVNH